MIKIFAPAKVNLALHVTGQRPDGYHMLDSIVVLLDCGDVVSVSAADVWSFTADGPFGADVPLDDRNLISKAARWLEGYVGRSLPAQVHLTKNLPASSGIGGGSSDAAAVIKGLCQLYNIDQPAAHDLVCLGSDLPVCMGQGVMRMRGIGEHIEQLETAASFSVLLVNPKIEVSTPAVFKRLSRKDNSEITEQNSDFVTWLAALRNDLQSPAIELAPGIQDVLNALEKTNGLSFARMSGSGATCFALYPDAGDCADAAQQITKNHPKWWVSKGRPILSKI